MQKDYQGLAPNASGKARAAWQKEHADGGFTCTHCGAFVSIDERMGTLNRNHCTTCLWSKHVDEEKGDRAAICGGSMMPIGLTFKHEGMGKTGEIMLIHQCEKCNKISINRIARDDPEATIMQIYENSLQTQQEIRDQLAGADIYLAGAADAGEVRTQLFGK